MPEVVRCCEAKHRPRGHGPLVCPDWLRVRSHTTDVCVLTATSLQAANCRRRARSNQRRRATTTGRNPLAARVKPILRLTADCQLPTSPSPQANFDFSHMQYLPCGYGRQCKYGLTCTRAHSSPPQAEIAYWNYVQPLGAPSRRRRAATQKNLGKDWSLTTLFECKICGVRMNSAAQLTQHHAGSKHRAQAALKSSAGPVPAIVAPPGQPTVLPHGTGPFYTNMAADWSGGSPRGGPTTASAGLVDGMVDLEIAPSVENGFVNDDPMTRTNWAKKQAYITAVKTGDNAEVTRLIKEGVDIDARDSGCPALHWAIFMGRVNTVSLLVKLGARKDLQDLDKQTAVHICVHPRHGMMNQMRRESKTSNVPFNYNEDAVRVLTTLMQVRDDCPRSCGDFKD